jgi:hypothetical protein
MDHYSLTCRSSDSTELVRNQQFLDSIAQFQFINGEEQFLYDLGMAYYKIYNRWQIREDLLKSIEANERCWEEYNNPMALWNLGTNYGQLNNCEKQLELTERYINYMKNNELEEYISFEQVYYRYKFCRNK